MARISVTSWGRTEFRKFTDSQILRPCQYTFGREYCIWYFSKRGEWRAYKTQKDGTLLKLGTCVNAFDARTLCINHSNGTSSKYTSYSTTKTYVAPPAPRMKGSHTPSDFIALITGGE